MGVERTPTKSSARGSSDPSSSDSSHLPGTPGMAPSIQKDRINNIIVPSLNHKELVGIVDSLGLELKLRRGERGSTILVNSLEKQQVVLNTLKDKKIDCFTSGRTETASDKFLLYGLCDYNEAELTEELKSRNLPVSTIKKFNNKQASKRETFLICFRVSSKITIERVRQERSLFNTLVNWKKFEDREPRASQCFNCLQFGHASSACKSAPVCVLCAKAHSKAQCPLPKLENGKVDAKFLRCALCKGNHTASFSACPTRTEYIRSQEMKQSQGNLVLPPPNSSDFPKLKSVSLTNTWPQLPVSTPWRPITPPTAVAIQSKGEPLQPGDQLLGVEELWRIFLDFSSRLASCKTRNEQIEAVAGLAISYIIPIQQTKASAAANSICTQSPKKVNKLLTARQTSSTILVDNLTLPLEEIPSDKNPITDCVPACATVTLETTKEPYLSSTLPHSSIAVSEAGSLPSGSSSGPLQVGKVAPGNGPEAESTRILRSATSGPR